MHRIWLYLLMVQGLVSHSVSAEAPAPVAAAPAANVAAKTSEPSVAVAATEPSDEELHNGLRRLQATMEKALNTGDIDTILANVDERVVFTTMNGDVVRGPEGIRAYFARMMEGPERVVEKVTSHFEADDLSILHGKQMAVAFGHTSDHYVLAEGGDFDIKARWSGTLLQRDGKWRIASFHYSTNVFDNAVLSLERRTLLGMGACATLLAAWIAFLLGKRAGKRSAA